jgi:PAS domain S-box-containing protein
MNETTMAVPNGSSRSFSHGNADGNLFAEEDRLLTERVREALWLSQAQLLRWQEWFSFSSDGHLVTDLHGVIEEGNYVAAVMLNARKEFLLGKPLGLFLTVQSQPMFYNQLRCLAAGEGVEQWEAQVCRPPAPLRELKLTVVAYPDERGQGIKLHWLLRDVTASRRAERAWLAEKELADCLLESAEILIFLVTERGRILRCNPHALAVSGYRADELHGQSWPQLFLPDEEREAGCHLLEQAAMEGAGRSGVVEFVARQGKRRRVLWSARKLDAKMLLIGHDVTDLQEAQRQALQAERLAAIGQMAAGVAHESRNALQRSQACLALLSLRLRNQPECLELLGRIEKAQDDLQRLFEDVRTYAAAPRLQRRCYNLSESWREAWNNLAGLPQWPSAELCEDIDNVDLFCEADSFSMRQVFRNLLENALSSGASPPRVTIRCRPAPRGAAEALCIRLRDNGPGISAQARPRLFEPFFTTKMRGTGLGLAICKRIIEAHGGCIHVQDDSLPGTEMVILLPRRGA